jgi:Domain of unknown function (DUF4214)
MVQRRNYLVAAICILLTSPCAPARQSGESDLVRNWFQRYLKRQPDPGALFLFTQQLQQGVPQIDVQGSILGSDEYFNRYGRRPDEFIRGLYQDTLDRQAGAPEVKIWLDRLREVNGDRSELAKRFLRSAQHEQVTGGLSPMETVRLWYRKFLGRDPDPAGIQRYVGLLRQGASPLDSEAELLGSDEYFNRYGQNVEAFIAGLYTDVLGRPPLGHELRGWLETYRQLGGNRQILARQFLGQAGVQIENNPAPPAGGGIPPDQQPGAVAQIINRTRYFLNTVQAEIPGTRQGQQCIMRGQALGAAAETLRVNLAQGMPINVLSMALGAVERSFGALREQLANPPGTARISCSIADQIGVAIVNLRNSPPFNGGVVPPLPPPGPGPLPPPVPPPGPPIGPTPSPGYDTTRVVMQLNILIGDNQRLLRQMGGQSYVFQNMRRDIEGLTGQLERMRNRAQQFTPVGEMQGSFIAMRRHSVTISEKMRGPEVPTYWQQQWGAIESNFSLLATLLQLPPNAGLPTSPLPPPGPNAPPPWPPGLVPVMDYVVAEIDAYLAALAPQVLVLPQLYQMQSHLNAMRADLLQARQEVVTGAPRSNVNAKFAHLQNQFAAVEALHSGMRGARVPPLTGLKRRMEELTRLLPR